MQVTFFRVAMHNAKFKHRDFRVYTGRADKTPRFPYFVAIKNEGGWFNDHFHAAFALLPRKRSAGTIGYKGGWKTQLSHEEN
jgi:hypothetical protein